MAAKVKVPPGTQIQTLIFNKDRFYSGKKVKQWLHLWGFPLPGVALHETEDSFRVRQGMPGEFELGSFRTIELSDGIKAVIAKPKVDMASKKKKNSAVRMNPKLKDILYSQSSGWDSQVSAAKNILALDKKMGKDINPMHFPKTAVGRKKRAGRPKSKPRMPKVFGKGRKAHITWWVVDMYDWHDELKRTLIGHGVKEQATSEARKLVKGNIMRVELSGPYYFKPSKEVVRK